MDLNLKGKRAVVTGATRGIGRAIAETLAAEGADVAVCARHAGQVEETVTALGRKGARAIGAMVNVADGAALKGWVTEAGRTLGGIDILVSNPSAFAMGNTEQDWTKSVEVDLLGAVRAVEAATPFLEQSAKARGDASIVIIASASAAETDFEFAYGPIKAALVHFAKGVARRQASKRIRANVVSPGTVFFENGFWDLARQHMPDQYKNYLARNPTGRMATPQEIANAVAFLASPVSSFTTGVNLLVDGAITARVNF